MAPLVDDSALLNKALITRLQEIVGTLLYYARAVDNTMLVALSTLPYQTLHNHDGLGGNKLLRARFGVELGR